MTRGYRTPILRQGTGPIGEWRKSAIALLACVLIIGGGAIAWFATMPYPVAMWWEAKKSTQYESDWAVSRSGYAAARRLVEKRMGFREIIGKVTVTGPDEIRFETMSRWTGPLAAAGQEFVAKKVGSEREISDESFWVS